MKDRWTEFQAGFKRAVSKLAKGGRSPNWIRAVVANHIEKSQQEHGRYFTPEERQRIDQILEACLNSGPKRRL